MRDESEVVDWLDMQHRYEVWCGRLTGHRPEKIDQHPNLLICADCGSPVWEDDAEITPR